MFVPDFKFELARIQDVESINIKIAEIRFSNLAQIDPLSISSINNQTLAWKQVTSDN